MTTIERTVYPRLKTKKPITEKELQESYTPTDDEKLFVKQKAYGDQKQFNLMLLLKAFQRLGYFPDIEDIPASIVKHIIREMDIASDITPIYHSSNTMYKHYAKVRTYLNVESYLNRGRRVAIEAVFKSAHVMDNPADLINVAIEELIRQRFELPAFNTLQRLVQHVRAMVNLKIFRSIVKKIPESEKDILLNLIIKDEKDHKSQYNRIKRIPKNPILKHFKEYIFHLQWLMELGYVNTYLKEVSHNKIETFASQASALDASELKKFSELKKLSFIVCLIYQAKVTVRDNLAEMFIRRISAIHKKGLQRLKEFREAHRAKSENLIETFGDVLKVMTHKPEGNKAWGDIKKDIEAKGGVEHLLKEYEEVSAYNGNNYLPLLWNFYQTHRPALFSVIQVLEIKPTTQDNSLINALKFILENRQKRIEFIAVEEDSKLLSFASKQWKKFVFKKMDDNLYINRRHFELCVFSYVASDLKSIDLYVEGSSSFADHREQLLPMEECEKLIPEYCQALGFPETGAEFVKDLKIKLTQIAKEVDQGYPNNDSLSIDEKGVPVLKKIKAKKNSKSALSLKSLVVNRMPERNILDILCNSEYWVNWSRHFEHVSGSQVKLDNPLAKYLLTTFSYSSNMGPVQASKHFKGLISPHVISYINRRHIDAKKLDKGIRDLVNTFNLFHIPKLWGKLEVVAADGTLVDLYEHNLMGATHIRYGRYGGIGYYHISDTYIALFSHFIPCGVWEAIYIIEALLKNKSDIQPNIIHSDTQGQSLPVYALAYMLGIDLQCRIRNWKDLKFYRPASDATYQHIDSLFSDSIDWDLIETHWKDLLQVLLSIKEGKISSAVLLRKLGTYSRKNRLYKAFLELGKVIRTIYLLKLISDTEMRKELTSSTNKVESFHNFTDWLRFGSEGIITTPSLEEQEKSIKYSHLLANAVILQNVIDISSILTELIQEGYDIKEEDVGILSPYLIGHLKRFGDYMIDLNNIPPALESLLTSPFK